MAANPDKHYLSETRTNPTIGAPNASRSNDAREVKAVELSKFKMYSIIAAVDIAIFLIGLNAAVVATAIPQITNEFNSVIDVGWYASAYLITICAVQPLAGQLYTHFSSKNLFLGFLVLFGIGSILCGAAVSSPMFIIGRAIAGMGGSGIMNGTLSITFAVTPKEKRPMLMAVNMALASIGSVIGPLVGGVLTEKASWRWCFYINPIIGAVCLVGIVFLHIPEQRDKDRNAPIWTIFRQKIDIIGFILFAPAVVMCLIAVEWGGSQFSWSSATIIGLLCGSLATFVVFILWQYHKGPEAMIPLHMLRYRIVLFGALVGFFQWGGLLTLSYYLPVWFQTVKGASPLMSGVMMLPTILAQAIGSVVAAKLLTKIGYYLPFAFAGAAFTSLGSGLMTTFTPGISAGAWIGYQILAGLGRGMVFQIPITAVQALLSRDEYSIASAILFFMQYFGGGLIVALAQTVFANRLGPALQVFAPNLNAHELLHDGATKIRASVSTEQLQGIILAYNRTVTETFYLSVGVCCMSVIFSLGLGWKSINEKKTTDQEK